MTSQEPLSNIEEIAACRIALGEIPSNQANKRAEKYARLGVLYARTGKLNESIVAFLNALSLDSKEHAYRIQFSEAIKFAEFTVPHAGVKQAILECFAAEGVNLQNLAMPSLSLLKLMPSYGSLDGELLDEPLLHSLLEYTVIPDAGFEHWMTSMRKNMLLAQATPSLSFATALAAQCFLNEYVYVETEEESAAVERLAANPGALKPLEIALLGAYRPLYTVGYPWSKHLPEAIQKLIRSQVDEPLIEKKLASAIPCLKKPLDKVSLAVQAQYEENPYPRWKTAAAKSAQSIALHLHSLFPNYHENGFSKNPHILVAGCGTGQQAINVARTYRNSQVVALDLSANSLAYAARKAQELHVENIKFLQGDILDLNALGETFDLIECSGVLHHMQDPLKGWKILAGILTTGGVMAISLYSKTARQDIVAARRFIEEQGFIPTLEGIRKCRQMLMKIPEFNFITHSIDFYTTSSCRDLLFHVQEQYFTLNKIADALRQMNLEFIGMELNNPEVMEQFAVEFPKDRNGTSLANWSDFEQRHPQTFAGMYHLWLQQKDKQED